MSIRNTYPLAQVESITGIPAEEIHRRIMRSELLGDGNLAMPGNRRAGTVNEATMKLLLEEGRTRREAVTSSKGVTRNHFQVIPVSQAAQELRTTPKGIEDLLSKGELEGPMLNHRYTGVTPGSLSTYKARLEHATLLEATEASVVPADLDNPEEYARQGVKVEYLSLASLMGVLTGGIRN